ncbi:MAG: serine hydrolase [Lachnospiraceae bacterium]
MQELLKADFVKKEMDYWNIPGFSIAVCYQGEIAFEKGYGYRNLTTKKPMTPETLGGIASCSKSFTSAVLASLVDEGTLDFDRPVIEYIPDFALMDEVATSQVTVRDMLYHRTGLAGHDAMWPDPSIDRDEFMHRLRYLETNKPFRSATQYSNVIYALLGHIAEKISGKTWEELVQTRIFDPLGMKRSCLTVGDMRKDGNFATGYIERIRGKDVIEMPGWEMDVGAPAAGVNSCVDEMMKWLQLHLDKGVYQGKRLFSEKVMEEMHQGVADMDICPWNFEETPQYGFYGMGWKTFFYRGLPVVFHSGEIEGYCSIEIMIPEKNLGMMLLVNKHRPSTPFLYEMVYTVIDTALGYPHIDWAERIHPYDDYFNRPVHNWEVNLMPEEAVKGTALSHSHDEYAGIFHNEAYGKMEVIKETDQFYLLYKQWKLPMEHFHYDTFKISGLKEDTLFITMPLTYHYHELSGEIDGFYLKIEPEVSSVWFQKMH